jgi:hypothetical protein
MKLKTSKIEFDSLPVLNRLFIALWKSKKGYTSDKELSFGELVELSLALTNHLEYDSPALRTTFNNALHYEEIQVAWDGKQPIDILFYELNQKLKRRIVQYLVVNSK